MDQLNQTDRELLNSILMKDKDELTSDDIAVLNARRTYLTYAQKQAYDGILINDSAEPNADAAQNPRMQTEYSDPQQNLAPADQPTAPSVPQAPATPANPYDVDPEQLV